MNSIDSLKEKLSVASDTIETANRERMQVFHDIADSTSNIENDVSNIKEEVSRLHQEVTSLKQELADERNRAEQAEKKAQTDSQRISIWIAILGATFGVFLSFVVNQLTR